METKCTVYVILAERIDPNVSLQFLKRASQYRPGEDHGIPDMPIETDDDNEAQALFKEFVDQKKVCFIILLKVLIGLTTASMSCIFMVTIAYGTRYHVIPYLLGRA